MLLADAGDVYLSNAGSSLFEVKEHFQAMFVDTKIVFSLQIYCCNPWSLQAVARKLWDDFFGAMYAGPEGEKVDQRQSANT